MLWGVLSWLDSLSTHRARVQIIISALAVCIIGNMDYQLKLTISGQQNKTA